MFDWFWRAVDWVTDEHEHLIDDPMLNYPIGIPNPRPPVFDWTMALTGLAMSPFFDGDVEESTWWAVEFIPALFGALIVFPIFFLSADRGTLTTPSADVFVGQTLLFGSFKRFFFDQQPLPFIPLAGAAPLHHDRIQNGILLCASGQRGISRRKPDEMIQVSARKAETVFLLRKGYPASLAEFFVALTAGRRLPDDEDGDFIGALFLGFHDSSFQ